MKKPIIAFKTHADAVRLIFMLILCVSASLLFFMPEESLPVFSNGAHQGINGLFNLVNGWV